MPMNNAQTTGNTSSNKEDADKALTADQLIQKYDCVTLEEFDDMLGYEILRQFGKVK